VIEKMKSRTAREGRESQDKPLMTNRLSITTKEDDELHVGSRRGIGIIKRRRTKKTCGLLLSVFDAGRSMLCARVEAHRRGVVHRMERRHRA
jgi:hypothetical protein